MATQFAEPQGDGGNTSPPADAPRDYEGEARKMGWSPPEEFKGDPAKHVDAETFVKRGEEMMPFLKAQNKKLLARLDQAERTAKQAAEFFSKAEQRAYERAVAEIRAEQEAAVESGDVAAHRAAADKLDKLDKPSAPTATEGIKPEDAQEALIDWRRDNKWFGSNQLMTDYAEIEADRMLKAGMMPGPEHLAKIREKVMAKFPEEFEDKGGEPEQRRRSAVDGGNIIPPRRGGKTFNDLPSEAKMACDRFIKAGYVKDRETYVKNYQW